MAFQVGREIEGEKKRRVELNEMGKQIGKADFLLEEEACQTIA